MSYDHWKTTDPADEWLGPEPADPAADELDELDRLQSEDEPEHLCTKCGALATYGKELCWWCWQAKLKDCLASMRVQEQAESETDL